MVPTLVLQIFVTWLFYDILWDNVTRRLARSLVGDINLVIAAHERFGPDDPRFQWLLERAETDFRGAMIFTKGEKIAPWPGPPTLSIMQRELAGMLDLYLQRPYAIDADSQEKKVIIAVQLPDGTLRMVAPLSRLWTRTSWLFVVLIAGMSLILFGLAILFVRRELRPVMKLGAIAEALGKGRDVPDFRPEGSLEARQTASAFLTMRERLGRQIQQRTEMLAGVSHDLRTPLTRMKLSLAMLDEGPDKHGLETDIADMERMVEGYLAFARGEGDEQPFETDLAHLITDVVEGARRAGAVIATRTEGEPHAVVRPLAMKRAIGNLVSNAQRYGKRIEVAFMRRKAAIEVIVDDDGPGIPPERREEMFRAFHRLDRSRKSAHRRRRAGSPSRAMSRATTAARSISRIRRSAVCARASGCRSDQPILTPCAAQVAPTSSGAKPPRVVRRSRSWNIGASRDADEPSTSRRVTPGVSLRKPCRMPAGRWTNEPASATRDPASVSSVSAPSMTKKASSSRSWTCGGTA